MIAKDFQEATANRIVNLFQEGHKRVLLADEVGLGKAHQRTQEERRDAVALARALDLLVVGVVVGLAQNDRDRVVGQVLQRQFAPPLVDARDLTDDDGQRMHIGRPGRLLAAEEAQHVVGIGRVQEAPHEVVAPR